MNSNHKLTVLASFAFVIVVLVATTVTRNNKDVPFCVLENIEALSMDEVGSISKWQTYGCGVFQGYRYACTTNKLTTPCEIDCGTPNN